MKKLLIFLLPFVLALVACDTIDEPDGVNAEFIKELNETSVHYVRSGREYYSRPLGENTEWSLVTVPVLDSGIPGEIYGSNPEEIIVGGGKCWIYAPTGFDHLRYIWQHCSDVNGDTRRIYIGVPFSIEGDSIKMGELQGVAVCFNSKNIKIAIACGNWTFKNGEVREVRIVREYTAIESDGVLNPNVLTFDSTKEGALYIIKTARSIFGDRLYNCAESNSCKNDSVNCPHYWQLDQMQSDWENQ